MSPAKSSFNFPKFALLLVVTGVFIPSFTAILLVATQLLLSFWDVECILAWKLIFYTTSFAAIANPCLMLYLIKKAAHRYNILNRLIVFNIVEYILLQAAFAQFFTTGNTLCYVTDGQNGMEFVFTAWMSLPILVALSYFFYRYRLYTKQNIIQK